MSMPPEKAKELRQPFPPEMVGRLPKGGMTLEYVGHAAVTDRLLTVDPDWNWEPLALDENGLPALDRAGNLWIRLTICGVTRIGVGDGKSAKECIGDAIRNAAMRFGVALDLWSKENLVEFAQAAAAHQQQPQQNRQQPPSDPQRRKMFALFREAGIDDRDAIKAWLADNLRPVESSSELDADEVSIVIDALNSVIANIAAAADEQDQQS